MIRFQYEAQIPFKESLERQESLKAKVKDQEALILGFECEKPVVSLGLRGSEKDILEKDKLKDMEVFHVKRGGEAVLHSPGQLVIYPFLHLPSFHFKIKDYILFLEEITKDFLKDLGISSFKDGDEAGLYTKRGKICFFGLHVSHGISSQGLALNVTNDLSLFDHIKTCGKIKQSQDKMEFYLKDLDLKDLFFKWCEKAKNQFEKRNLEKNKA